MDSAPPFQISHFSINAADVERASRFYGTVFGWKFQAWGPPGFFLVDSGGGIHGSLQQRRQQFEGEGPWGFECTVSVEDVDKSLALIEANGGTIVYPKSTIPGVGDIGVFLDPENNLACVARYDPNAR